MSPANTDGNNHFSILNLFNIILLLLVLGAAVYYFFFYQQQPEQVITPAVIEETIIIEPEPINIEKKDSQAVSTDEVITPEQPDETLPIIEVALDESDDSAVDSLSFFSDQTLIQDHLVKTDLLRSTVVFLDNFSQGEFLPKFSPLSAPKQAFVIEPDTQMMLMGDANYQRYAPHFLYLNSIDPKKFAQHYLRFKPLIDEAYAEISRPEAKFDEVIDRITELVNNTPTINAPIALQLESVSYSYQDEYLQSLNDAQKFLLRLGPTNLSILKKQIAAINAEIQALQ